MNSLRKYFANVSGSMSGAFRMRFPMLKQASNGQTFLGLKLEDLSGSLPGYVWHDHIFKGLRLEDLACIFVRGMVRQRQDGPVIDISQVLPLEQREGEVVRLIPQSVCPIPWLLVFLETFVSRLTTPALVRFVSRVLANDSIAFAFVSAPASLNHHHNVPGGLLMHSLSCVQMVSRFREFDTRDKELGMVAALMHDIGKTLTMTPQMQRTTLGAEEDHRKLTLVILDPYLRSLAHEWPQGEEQLRYLLMWKQGSQIPQYNMADVVACCDRISAGLDMQEGWEWVCAQAGGEDHGE
jgi:3'-5' exoribonuclease